MVSCWHHCSSCSPFPSLLYKKTFCFIRDLLTIWRAGLNVRYSAHLRRVLSCRMEQCIVRWKWTVRVKAGTQSETANRALSLSVSNNWREQAYWHITLRPLTALYQMAKWSMIHKYAISDARIGYIHKILFWGRMSCGNVDMILWTDTQSVSNYVQTGIIQK
jgi:hypothetical protein